MSTKELKKSLHNQIDSLDERSLNFIYNTLQSYIGNKKGFVLTDAHKALIDERLDDYEKNPENVISWEESKQLMNKRS